MQTADNERLELKLGPAEILAESIIAGSRGDAHYELRYRILCDPWWRVRSLSIASIPRGTRVGLLADGQGNWRDEEGNPLPALNGCIDIDISATPFTNTLPIRRLDLREGESQEIRVVYVATPDLTVSVAAQRYTCLRRGALYRYEALPSDFRADISVDSDGLVLEYPGLFRRADEMRHVEIAKPGDPRTHPN